MRTWILLLGLLGVSFPVGAQQSPSIEELAARLKDRRAGRQAAAALAKLGAKAVPALIEAVQGENEVAHYYAAMSLSTLGDQAASAVPAMVRILQGKDRQRRANAASVLASIGPRAAPAVPALRVALRKDASRSVRRVVVLALGKIGPKAASALPELAPLLGDPALGSRAAKALESIGAAAVPALVRAFKEPNTLRSHQATKALSALGPKASAAVPALLEAYRSKDDEVRSRAAAVLSRVGPKAAPAVPLLLSSLTNPEPRVRQEAMRVLEGIGPQAAPAVPTLNKLLSDKDVWSRRAAASALEAIGPAAAPAVPALTRALGDASYAMRERAARALGAIGPGAKVAVPALKKAMADKALDELEEHGIGESILGENVRASMLWARMRIQGATPPKAILGEWSFTREGTEVRLVLNPNGRGEQIYTEESRRRSSTDRMKCKFACDGSRLVLLPLNEKIGVTHVAQVFKVGWDANKNLLLDLIGEEKRPRLVFRRAPALQSRD